MSFDSIYTIIEYIGQNAKSVVECGARWERAVMFYPRNDSEMRQIMGDVRLCADARTNDGHDMGLVFSPCSCVCLLLGVGKKVPNLDLLGQSDLVGNVGASPETAPW